MGISRKRKSLAEAKAIEMPCVHGETFQVLHHVTDWGWSSQFWGGGYMFQSRQLRQGGTSMPIVVDL